MRLEFASYTYDDFKFQSTHPHGVRPFMGTPWDIIIKVSIHAPTRGATQFNPMQSQVCFVSIHAPTRGATLCTQLRVCYCMFQSTHPHGVRLGKSDSLKAYENVSIHAPTRGATQTLLFS